MREGGQAMRHGEKTVVGSGQGTLRCLRGGEGKQESLGWRRKRTSERRSLAEEMAACDRGDEGAQWRCLLWSNSPFALCPRPAPLDPARRFPFLTIASH